MALVVFLRGVNVGGHRRFRPSTLAAELKHLGAVNIGAAGTLVIRARITRAKLRAELARRLPFETTIAICHGGDIARLIASEPYACERPGPMSFASPACSPDRRARNRPCPWHFPVAARGSSRSSRATGGSSSASIGVT